VTTLMQFCALHGGTLPGLRSGSRSCASRLSKQENRHDSYAKNAPTTHALAWMNVRFAANAVNRSSLGQANVVLLCLVASSAKALTLFGAVYSHQPIYHRAHRAPGKPQLAPECVLIFNRKRTALTFIMCGIRHHLRVRQIRRWFWHVAATSQ
jgi:hypothetical protein